MASNDFFLNVWRLHSKSVRIVPAEKTLLGTASPNGVKWCRPFTIANSLGWWIYPAIDMDILWKGRSDYELRMLERWPAEEHALAQSLLAPDSRIDLEKFCPATTGRSKIAAVEDGVISIWTGCIFQTPPGYNLHIRPPINFPNRPFRVMEGVIESDWLQYDIWMNIVFEKRDEWIPIRKNDAAPIAQLVPVWREGYEAAWALSDHKVSRDTPQASEVADFWLDYNQRKFGMGGPNPMSAQDPSLTKNSSTYYRVRAESMGKGFSAMVPRAHLPDADAT